MDTFSVKIVSPSAIVFQGFVWQISACNSRGAFAIRAGHSAMFTKLTDGKIEVAAKPDERSIYMVSNALLEFSGNTCSIVCEKTDYQSP